jgi:hypothetical protein
VYEPILGSVGAHFGAYFPPKILKLKPLLLCCFCGLSPHCCTAVPRSPTHTRTQLLLSVCDDDAIIMNHPPLSIVSLRRRRLRHRACSTRVAAIGWLVHLSNEEMSHSERILPLSNRK